MSDCAEKNSSYHAEIHGFHLVRKYIVVYHPFRGEVTHFRSSEDSEWVEKPTPSEPPTAKLGMTRDGTEVTSKWKVVEGADAWSTHDDPGSSSGSFSDPATWTECSYTCRTLPNFAALSALSATNYCDYWKTAATDGNAVHIGGANSVDEHTNVE